MKTEKIMKSLWPFLGVLFAVCGCTRESAPRQEVNQAQPFRPIASIRELMESEVAPAADVIWNSVATVSSEDGFEEKRPRTDEEWRTVRHNAVTLIEASNLLIMEGRKVAGPGATPRQPSEPPTADIEKRIAANRAGFIQFSHALQDAGMAALADIDAKNAEGLLDAGAKIDEACEACHQAFWYPQD